MRKDENLRKLYDVENIQGDYEQIIEECLQPEQFQQFSETLSILSAQLFTTVTQNIDEQQKKH